jgi:hypothetical protein
MYLNITYDPFRVVEQNYYRKLVNRELAIFHDGMTHLITFGF